LKHGFTFIDVGCGNGFFALPAARLVGEKGKVYGLDANAEAIGMLKKTAMKEGLRNLNLGVGMAEEIVLCDSCADVVFFGIVLHDFKDAIRVLSNARRMLKSTGKLVDLDWKKEPMKFGPPLQIRFSEEKAVSLIEAAGFKINSVKDAGTYHYLIVAH
jgi:ubiquinone/menaquinone biosynthesis C-methylase UbiE